MITRTRQEIVMSETRVTGGFRHGDLFQISPNYPDAPIFEWLMGHHPFLLEYRYSIPEISETISNPCFLSACFLFDQGVELFHQTPSLAFAACVSSLETLIAADHKGQDEEHCKDCGQVMYKVRQKFLEFIERYGNDSPETRNISDKVYSHRSKILHEGQLFLGETEPRTIEAADEWLKDDHQRRDVIRFFRACIINWLIGRPNEQSTP